MAARIYRDDLRVLAPAAGDAGRTTVAVVTDLDVTGKAAQFGRGLIGDVSAKLVGQFADTLAALLATTSPAAPGGEEPPAPPSIVDEEADAIDLLSVAGVPPVVRKALPYVATAVASFAVVLGLVWWIKRR